MNKTQTNLFIHRLMDSMLYSLNTYSIFLAASVLTALFWLYTRWSDFRCRQAFAQRNLKYVNLGNLFVDIVLRRRVELKKDALIKGEGKLWGFSMLGRYTVLVAEPELIQQVMSKEFTNFTNRRVSGVLNRVI